ncbi:MAG: N-acetylmuramoyl-L-alanine amidase [Pseudomonadota bacterium]|nr:N-acetylmuramoyl-L-alanine amidase [Pseudomonadota bacterium]
MDIIEHPSPNFDQRPEGVEINMLVIHYTGMKMADEALARLCDPGARVSSHYFITEDGKIYCLVSEVNRAWHAGVSFWRGETDCNGCSIGIELQNPGHEFGYENFPEAQVQSLETLARDILGRHPIPPTNVVGHSDIAPARKSDPGERFPWRRLAGRGIGAWPESSGARDTGIAAGRLLADLGYQTEDLGAALTAFQRHYRTRVIDGEADDETLALMVALKQQG